MEKRTLRVFALLTWCVATARSQEFAGITSGADHSTSRCEGANGSHGYQRPGAASACRRLEMVEEVRLQSLSYMHRWPRAPRHQPRFEVIAVEKMVGDVGHVCSRSSTHAGRGCRKSRGNALWSDGLTAG